MSDPITLHPQAILDPRGQPLPPDSRCPRRKGTAVRARERLSKIDFAVLVIEGSITEILRSNEVQEMSVPILFQMGLR